MVGLRTWLLSCIVVFAALLANQPANATPPDIIIIRDEPFAIAPGTMFVLRTTRDNLGTYSAYSERIEVFLVGMSLADGSETVWPVHGATRMITFGEEGEQDRWQAPVDVRSDGVDPFAMVTVLGGTPLLADDLAVYREHMVARDDGVVTIRTEYSGSFAIQHRAAVERLNASVGVLAEQVSPVDRLGPVPTRDYYRQRSFQPEDCAIQPLGSPIANYADASFHLVRTVCGDKDGIDATSLIQIADSVVVQQR